MGLCCNQSQRHALHQETFELLQKAQSVYPCHCSRKNVAQIARKGPDGYIYPGTYCQRSPSENPSAWHLKTADQIRFCDRLHGYYQQDLAQAIGDFIIKRADGVWSYQLAVVIDDADQHITHIVRGADLLISTPRRIYLHHCLTPPTPSYCHLPILIHPNGEKLSKQTMAPAISAKHVTLALRQALHQLGHPVPAECETLAEIWAWAKTHWRLKQVLAEPVSLPSS